jgi:drug/metabolite transporter (DMT)-like permease
VIEIPILGALALSVNTILEKIILKKKELSVKKYQVLGFLAIIVAMLPIIYFFWKISSEAFTLRNIFIFILVVVFSVIANFLYYYSLKNEKVSKLQPARILEPLFTILLSIVFSFIFGEILYEKNLNIIIPAIIATLALVFSHVKKHHLKLSKYFIIAIFASFFFALELVTSRLILDLYSPITFYFLRCVSIFLISFAVFRPKLSGLKGKTYGKILLISAIWIIYRMIIYYGYLNYGVIFTTLMITLGPILVYFLAWIFLKDKPKLREIIASLIILACVIYVILT